MKICRQRISRVAAQSVVLVAGLIWALLPVTPARSESEPASLAGSEQVVSYLSTYEVLAQLLDERYVLEGTVSSASAAERSALDRLASAEERLARLLAEREQRSALEWSVQALIAEAETALPAIDALHDVAGRRIASQEAWLFGTANVKTPSMRGYLRTLELGEELDRERRQVEEGVAQAQEGLAAAVLDLGRLNTEVAFHERQADALSREVGATRARALRASARLGGVEEQARVLVDQLHTQLDVLRRLGHPIGVAVASSGPPPVPDPLQWPQSPPRRYVLPFGASAAALRHGEPLRLLPQQIHDLGVFETGWQAPVSGQLTTPYGDATPYQAAHWAIDVGTKLYAPVQAAADGVVEFVGLATGDNRLASYGMVVLVRHGERVTSLSAHLDDRAYGPQVKVGDAVKKGQVIGYVGLTGLSTGPHLHYEIRVDGQPIDPLSVVKLK